MRQLRSQIRQRHQARNSERERDLHLHVVAGRLWSAARRVGQRARLWPAAPVLVLLLGTGVALGGGAPGGHGARSSSGASLSSAGRRLASTSRSTARWIDPVDKTAFILALQESPRRIPGGFTFTLPTGDEISVPEVGSSLFALASELRQVAPDAPFDAQVGFCGYGALQAANPQASGVAHAVNVAVSVHVGQGGLLAYAGLTYAPGADTLSACKTPAPQYEMKAGCSSLTTCSPLLTPAEALGQYDTAVVSAAQSGNWSTVYTLTGQAVTGQYSASAFATIMNQQAQSVGRITAITPAGAAPAIQFDAAGQAYFVARDVVTLDHNGATSQIAITSYYLLEDESGTAIANWQLWFSVQPGACPSPCQP